MGSSFHPRPRKSSGRGDSSRRILVADLLVLNSFVALGTTRSSEQALTRRGAMSLNREASMTRNRTAVALMIAIAPGSFGQETSESRLPTCYSHGFPLFFQKY